MSAQIVSYIPTFLVIINTGIKVTWIGTAIAATIKPNIGLFSLNLKRARGYDAQALINSNDIKEIPTTMTLFKK